ncbi:hypothetical protein AZI85_05825 [Bdellovibrio bacteriovorus]|uniref:Uncharacterized protein n=1 Tax=Bdellovibrio bacteriovorus TaxID=959 RepID=A0A150WFM0_BDEBC|nr:hypothetical protein [Bdellovibrio bacteriovorus]KYG61743.1 hypothetical protein AZI85_05825 [Bdellovibrio bacteriovorus]
MRPAFIKGHCRKNPEGYTTWLPKIQDNLPSNWPHKNESSRTWSTEEKEKVLEAMATIPPELWSPKITGIHRAKRSKDHPNPATSADGIIVVYDSAFERERNLARIFTHELAHQKYYDMTLEQRESYWYPMNWLPINSPKNIFISRSEGFVQDDGRESPEEDFANNVEYFLFDPKKLEKTTPHATKWIKKYFGDKFKIREK